MPDNIHTVLDVRHVAPVALKELAAAVRHCRGAHVADGAHILLVALCERDLVPAGHAKRCRLVGPCRCKVVCLGKLRPRTALAVCAVDYRVRDASRQRPRKDRVLVREFAPRDGERRGGPASKWPQMPKAIVS